MKKTLLVVLSFFMILSTSFAQNKPKKFTVESLEKTIENDYVAITDTEKEVSGATFKMTNGQALIPQTTEEAVKNQAQEMEKQLVTIFNGGTWKFEPCQNHLETKMNVLTSDSKNVPTTYFPMGGILGVKIFDDITNTGVYVFQHKQNKRDYIFMFALPIGLMYAVNAQKN